MENLRAQIEVVFALTGGELEDKPRRYWDRERKRRGWFRYWYPYVPEYAESDFRRFGGSTSGDFFTVIWDSGDYGSWLPPRRILLADGRIARLVRTFTSSGECECPNDDAEPGSECPLCEEDHDGETSYIYLGAGWLEAVYRVRG